MFKVPHFALSWDLDDMGKRSIVGYGRDLIDMVRDLGFGLEKIFDRFSIELLDLRELPLLFPQCLFHSVIS